MLCVRHERLVRRGMRAGDGLEPQDTPESTQAAAKGPQLPLTSAAAQFASD